MICKKCGKDKTEDEFYFHSTSGVRRQPCRECQGHKKMQPADIEAHKAYMKAYREKNREKLRAREREYREENREYFQEKAKKYREANKEKIAARRKVWLTKEKQKEYNDNSRDYRKKRYQEKKHELRLQNKTWFKNHPDYWKEYAKKRKNGKGTGKNTH